MLTSFSPSLTSKKSNEIIQGSLSSIKYAANSLTRKFDEIKGAFSTQTTPVKTPGSVGHAEGTTDEDMIAHEDGTLKMRRVSSDLDPWGRLSESRKSSYNNLVPLGENSSALNLSAFPVLPENLYTAVADVSLQIKIKDTSKKFIYCFK